MVYHHIMNDSHAYPVLRNKLPDEELTRRERPREEDFRGPYYRDTTAIIHSSAFRRLKHKTQVFFAPSNDHICTRIEHVLHVASIASSICKPLSLDSEMAWAIGLGHDLGHTPFGHVGERIISRFSEEWGLGPFEHEVNSLKVVTKLCNSSRGLNLTYAVRDGIVCHNGESFQRSMCPEFKVKDLGKIKSRKGLTPSTFEGVIVRFSDSIAYLGRDYEDAYRMGILDAHPLPESVRKVLGEKNSDIINTLVLDLVENSSEDGISLSEGKYEAVCEMMEYNYRYIYKSEILNGYTNYFTRLLSLIRDYLYEIATEHLEGKDVVWAEKNMLAYGFVRHMDEKLGLYPEGDKGLKEMIIDYMSGMSDNFALDAANEILRPEHLNETLREAGVQKWFDKGEY